MNTKDKLFIEWQRLLDFQHPMHWGADQMTAHSIRVNQAKKAYKDYEPEPEPKSEPKPVKAKKTKEIPWSLAIDEEFVDF